MSQTDTADRNRQMEDAFETQNVPAIAPVGPQMVTIDDRPSGALKVAVERNNGKVLAKLKATAAAAGDDFFYRWPVKDKNGKTEWIEGPSVKCTNAVAREYGNCTVKVRAFDQGGHWMIQAQFVDLETGYVLERPFQQRKSQNIGGKMDKDRALDMVFQIGVSKATRNVVCNALSEFVDYAFAEAREAIVGRVGKNLEQYRGRVNTRLQELKVPIDRVEAQVGKTFEKWLAPDIARIIAEIQSVSDGMADPDEMWPPKEFGAPRPTENDNPDKQINEDRGPQQSSAPAAQPKAETAKAAEPAKAAAPAADPKPKAEAAQVEENAVAKQVSEAIRQAAAGDMDALKKLDEQVEDLLKREPDEEQNSRWGNAYVVRRGELRSGAKGESALLEMLPKAQAEPAKSAKEEELNGWVVDMKKEASAKKSMPDLEEIEERVGNELAGDQTRLDDWKNFCNGLARDLMGRKRR